MELPNTKQRRKAAERKERQQAPFWDKAERAFFPIVAGLVVLIVLVALGA